MMAEETSIIPASGGLPPNNDQRKPSMTPVIGFSPYNVFHFAGISLEE